MKLSKNLDNFETSAISSIFALVKDMRATGKDIVDLCVGEPDFDTSDEVKAAAHKAALEGDTKYTVIDGTMALKQSICKKFETENALNFQPNEISVGAGAKTVLHTTLSVVLDPGDEVVLLTPSWGSYSEMVAMLSAKQKLVRGDASNKFKFTPEALRESLTAKTKAIIFNSPSNPAGVTYTRQEYQAFADILRDFPDVWIISDEIYEHILFTDTPYVSFLNAVPDFRDRTITINGVSKAYAMTGWRIGWAAAPANVIIQMRKVISNSTSSPCSVSQAAAIAALSGSKGILLERNKAYLERRDMIFSKLSQIDELHVVKPDGAFYLYVDCTNIIGKTHPKAGVLNNSFEIVKTLLEEYGLAVVHGAAFQHDPAFRMSFAASNENLNKACDIIKTFVSDLK